MAYLEIQQSASLCFRPSLYAEKQVLTKQLLHLLTVHNIFKLRGIRLCRFFNCKYQGVSFATLLFIRKPDSREAKLENEYGFPILTNFVIHYPQNGKMRRQQRTVSADERESLREERSSIVLWRRPFTTINYGTRELALTLAEWAQQ